ncbi:hypothetical protein DFH09DRAFT_1311179 [Mycena vulgaris]|nr:hypothetical protein DFH09DRAFT_1311179 [Mycena vulgaris]
MVVARRVPRHLLRTFRTFSNHPDGPPVDPDWSPGIPDGRNWWEVEQGGELPPFPPALNPAMAAVLGEESSHRLHTWARRPVLDHIIFYHNHTLPESHRCLALLRDVFHNAAGHPAPFRFVFSVRRGVPSAERLRALVLLDGRASFLPFIHPRGRPAHVGGAEALRALFLSAPDRRLPVAQHVWWTPEGEAAAVFPGANAVRSVMRGLVEGRRRGVGRGAMELVRQMRADADRVVPADGQRRVREFE